MSDENEKVGPGKPPKEHRFQKGKTGNPNGRPRKHIPQKLSFAEIASMELDKLIEVMIKGGAKLTITTREAIVKKLIELAGKGDKAALQILMSLDKQSPRVPQFDPTPEDEEELERLLRQIRPEYFAKRA
jgi:hypothetical protein